MVHGMEDGEAAKIMAELNLTFFFDIARVLPGVPSRGAFTALKSTLALGQPHARVNFLKVLGVTKEMLQGQSENLGISAAVKRLVDVMTNQTRLSSLATGLLTRRSEKELFAFAATHVLAPLTGSCTLSQDLGVLTRMKAEDKTVNFDLPCKSMGMGWFNTWHGTPDGLCDIVPLSVAHMATSDGSESEESSGGKSPLEAKREFLARDLHQIIGQAVVMSFIHHNRHPKQPSIVPSVGIAGSELMAAMYDCKRDLLLLLQPPICWFSPHDKKCIPAATVALWALLHHQLLLKESVLRQFPEEFCCSLKHQFQQNDTLQLFEQLDRYDIANWPFVNYPPQGSSNWSPDDGDNLAPPMKKQKLTYQSL